MTEVLRCVVCGEPGQTTVWGPVGYGGVCRHPEDPNQEDQGQHVMKAEAG